MTQQEREPAPDRATDGATDGAEGFGDEAAEMANETEVEAPLPEEGAPTPAGTAGDDPSSAAPSPDAAAAEIDSLRARVAELTLDLQRLQAEYVNYKRRVERDRDLVKENATYAALAPITEVLDTIDRARESARAHEAELDSGFTTVADQLERVVGSAGLTKYGAPGDVFDPTLHEALSSMGPDPEVSVTTVKLVAKSGYKIGERVVRAAQVLTVEPA